MKKTPLLNVELSEVIAGLGHGDMLVIGDAGLPIPLDVRRIDLALTRGVPGFIDTLRTVLAEMQVQSVIVAEETGQKSPHILAAIKQLLPTTPIEVVSHELLKADTEGAVAVVRTGEFTPYANIILISGVVF
ncbi:MAG: D-ribose pyranase [Thermoflexales bacterium]|nr:D-ribose pyranase [Thermoflexales bacterium]